jgi:predicted porin
MSPNWNGFSFVAAVVMPSLDDDADGVEATSIAATYSNGPWFASLAYEDISGEMVDALYATNATSPANLVAMNTLVNDTHDYNKWRLGLGYTANGFHVGFVYEDRELDNLDNAIPVLDNDGESWQLSASYTMGNNTFKIAYGEADGMVRDLTHNFNVDDAEMWSIGVDHKLSNRTTVYAAYTDFESDDNPFMQSNGVLDTDTEYDAFSVGIIHKF